MTNITTSTRDNIINASKGSVTIAVQLGQEIPRSPLFLNEDVPLRFDGVAGDTYIVYNSTSAKLEFYVDGVKKFEV